MELSGSFLKAFSPAIRRHLISASAEAGVAFRARARMVSGALWDRETVERLSATSKSRKDLIAKIGPRAGRAERFLFAQQSSRFFILCEGELPCAGLIIRLAAMESVW